MMGYGPQNFNYGAMSAFYQANSLVAKFAFLVMVLLVFIVILRVGTAILAWYFSPPENPILLDGMIDATKTMIIPQNPLVKGAVPVSRSDNEIHGMEFTWSVWIFIESSTFNSSDHRYKHIFHKGTDSNIAMMSAKIMEHITPITRPVFILTKVQPECLMTSS